MRHPLKELPLVEDYGRVSAAAWAAWSSLMRPFPKVSMPPHYSGAYLETCANLCIGLHLQGASAGEAFKW